MFPFLYLVYTIENVCVCVCVREREATYWLEGKGPWIDARWPYYSFFLPVSRKDVLGPHNI